MNQALSHNFKTENDIQYLLVEIKFDFRIYFQLYNMTLIKQ